MDVCARDPDRVANDLAATIVAGRNKVRAHIEEDPCSGADLLPFLDHEPQPLGLVATDAEPGAFVRVDDERTPIGELECEPPLVVATCEIKMLRRAILVGIALGSLEQRIVERCEALTRTRVMGNAAECTHESRLRLR